MKEVFYDVTVSSDIDLEVKVKKRETQNDVFEYEFDLKWTWEQAQRPGASVTLLWDIPCVDVQYMWHPNCRARRVLDANWRLDFDSRLTGSAPLAMLFNGRNQNTFTFAVSEAQKVLKVLFGVEDSRNTITGEISMGLDQFAGKTGENLLVRADFRKAPYYRVLDDVREWWEETLSITPMAAPGTAKLPMYSSWYSFHQEIEAARLEQECVAAKELGMSAVIVDDGWQTEDTNCGYGYTGDWEVCKRKIPDMREHVRRVHEAGLKYILWYSVPFVGYYSKNWARFQDKLLCRVERNSCGVLDPRYSEVREFLIHTYENALKEYDLDGFKLDFIDRFERREEDVIKPEMDYRCVQEATQRLMTDIMQRLRAIKPDIMIEFRQKYIGPVMRSFGNMFRVSDCPGDITTNRVGTVDLRLLSGNTACHCDMLTWNNAEAVEDAALQILNSIFGVIQFSKRICDMPQEHKRMTAFWLGFAAANKKLLLESELIPYEPNFLYPVIEARDETEAIIGVYALGKVVKIAGGLRRVRLINATKEAELFLDFEEACEAEASAQNALGDMVWEKKIYFEKGPTRVGVPGSGLLKIERSKRCPEKVSKQ